MLKVKVVDRRHHKIFFARLRAQPRSTYSLQGMTIQLDNAVYCVLYVLLFVLCIYLLVLSSHEARMSLMRHEPSDLAAATPAATQTLLGDREARDLNKPRITQYDGVTPVGPAKLLASCS